VTIRTSPCDWPVQFPPGCDLPEAYSSLAPTGKALYEEMATDFLWRWTGRRFSVCEVTVRPCRENCWEGISTFDGLAGAGDYRHRPFGAVLLRGRVFNLGCGTCGDLCSCGFTPSLRLPGPIAEISSVQIDGTALDPAAYRVDNNSLLVRIDGDRWPTCQNMTATLGEADTWGITYKYGIPVPMGGQVAAGVLALELAKAACGADGCQLPKRLQTITRQGITVGFMDAFTDLAKGGTGIWTVDSWVTSVTLSPQAPRVRSVDVPRDRFRRTTWSG
jgi:hypothetical protein